MEHFPGRYSFLFVHWSIGLRSIRFHCTALESIADRTAARLLTVLCDSVPGVPDAFLVLSIEFICCCRNNGERLARGM